MEVGMGVQWSVWLILWWLLAKFLTTVETKPVAACIGASDKLLARIWCWCLCQLVFKYPYSCIELLTAVWRGTFLSLLQQKLGLATWITVPYVGRFVVLQIPLVSFQEFVEVENGNAYAQLSVHWFQRDGLDLLFFLPNSFLQNNNHMSLSPTTLYLFFLLPLCEAFWGVVVQQLLAKPMKNFSWPLPLTSLFHFWVYAAAVSILSDFCKLQFWRFWHRVSCFYKDPGKLVEDSQLFLVVGFALVHTTTVLSDITWSTLLMQTLHFSPCYNPVGVGNDARLLSNGLERRLTFLYPWAQTVSNQFYSSWLGWFLILLWYWHIAWSGVTAYWVHQNERSYELQQHFQWLLKAVPNLSGNTPTAKIETVESPGVFQVHIPIQYVGFISQVHFSNSLSPPIQLVFLSPARNICSPSCFTEHKHVSYRHWLCLVCQPTSGYCQLHVLESIVGPLFFFLVIQTLLLDSDIILDFTTVKLLVIYVTKIACPAANCKQMIAPFRSQTTAKCHITTGVSDRIQPDFYKGLQEFQDLCLVGQIVHELIWIQFLQWKFRSFSSVDWCIELLHSPDSWNAENEDWIFVVLSPTVGEVIMSDHTPAVAMSKASSVGNFVCSHLLREVWVGSAGCLWAHTCFGFSASAGMRTQFSYLNWRLYNK